LGGSGYCQSVGERLRGLKKTVLYKGEGWVKTFKAIHCMQPATRRNDFDFAVSSTATGCSILLLAVGSAAHAADAPASVTAADDAELQEVVVTGIRAAIESAISAKERADTIVETLSAEDIGKLPDTTIAESLARLPGLTTQRDRNGIATNISIRGLGPDFNGYLLNGREQTSTGDSRAVDLSVYPAELIGGATVYKTGDASLMTAGLAGTIDDRLVDPLAYPGLVVAGNFQEIKNGEGLPVTGKGKRYSLSFIDQFADRKLGIAIGFVHSDSHSNALASGSWSGTVPAIGPTGTALGNFNIPFDGLTYESDLDTDKRNGGAVILEFKPNESFSSELDV
jgi:iron complex outermembrane recepter protein